MDFQMITELISTLGFPIACVIALGVFIYKIYKKSEEREDKLMDELAENRKINADAIATIGKYASSLETIEEDIKVIKDDLTIIMGKQ
jgi:hypothetical protein